MEFTFSTQPAVFMARPNRYLVYARLEESGQLVAAHCADPGRLNELLVPGVRIHVSAAGSAAAALPRKTAWDLRLVEHPENGRLVSLDTRVPNRVFEEGWRAGFFPFDSALQSLRREVPHPVPVRSGPHSRADFLLAERFSPDAPLGLAGARCWVEVKSCSLVVDGIALFPDAITDRGRRHLLELASLVKGGERAAVVFVVQRPDAAGVRAHRATDAAFADALESAREAGVTLLGATCAVSTRGVTLERLVPVLASA